MVAAVKDDECTFQPKLMTARSLSRSRHRRSSKKRSGNRLAKARSASRKKMSKQDEVVTLSSTDNTLAQHPIINQFTNARSADSSTIPDDS